MKTFALRLFVVFAMIFAVAGTTLQAAAQYRHPRPYHRRYHRPYRRPYHRPYHRPYRRY